MKNYVSKSAGTGGFLIFILVLSLFALPVNGQQHIDALEKDVNQLHGKERIGALIELTDFYLSRKNEKKALKYARQAEKLAENILIPENPDFGEEDRSLKSQVFLRLGEAYAMRGRFMESKGAYMDALETAETFNLSAYAEEAADHIRRIDSISLYAPEKKDPFLGKAFQDIGNFLDQTTNEFGVTASLKLAKMYANQEDYEKAMNQYTIAKNLLKDLGDFEKMEEVDLLLAEIKEQMAEGGSSVSTPDAEPDTDDLPIGSEGGDIANSSSKRSATEMDAPQKSGIGSSVKGAQTSDSERIRRAAQKAESSKNLTESIDYYKQYISMQQQLQDERANQQLALLEQANEIENRDREILLLKQNDQIQELELKRQQAEIRQKKTANRNLAAGTGLLGAVLISLYFLYYNKRRDHKKLTDAYQALESTQNLLKNAQKKIKDLLHQQVSGAIADELLASTGNESIARKFVCIMFLDIRDFTVFAEERNPEDIIDYQNNVFGFMIDTINKHHGIVNQILGDGFMATFGAPISSGNDCQDAYDAAREIIEIVNEKSRTGEIPPTKVGIGLHAGFVVTGNVGTSSRKQYSITGNPVIIASRLEQLNKEFGSSIVISKDVYDHLPEATQSPMTFNEVQVKGRSKPVSVAAL